MGQTGRGLKTGYEGHIAVVIYDKFQSLLMNRHTKHEDVMKKIEALGEGIEFSCLPCGGNPNSRTILRNLCGILAMTRTDEQKCGKILN
jgi:hypothetical protein